MHRISFYQTHLTEGQWSYINKIFFENDCRHRKWASNVTLWLTATDSFLAGLSTHYIYFDRKSQKGNGV